jgi:LPXTG-site transpeptidase (sortase) family protein
MRRQGLFGSALLVIGLVGFAATQALPHVPAAVLEPIVAVVDTEQQPSTASITASDSHPMTRLVIASIGLDTPVSEARRVEQDGVTSWEVPKFVAGHAEGSASAGETGNAILLGHVTSLTLGNVFEHLHEVSVGDPVEVYTGVNRYVYRAQEVQDIVRSNIAVLDPTPDPRLTLITCSGLWLPTIRDYDQRLIVRAELIH